MNKPIRNLAIGCLVLLLALLVNATYLQFWKATELNSLAEHPDNRRVLNEDFSRPRGDILVGTKAIAESKAVDDPYKFQRTYPSPLRYAHLTGFFTRDDGIGGVEATRNDALSGNDAKLFVKRVIDMVGNQTPEGGSVRLTIDEAAQKAAYEGMRALGPRTRGAVVAIQPSTGKILAMVSSPTFDPNRLATHDFSAARTAREGYLDDELSPLNNRAIEEVLPPGSTFKLVTAAAALESGRYQPDTLVPGGASLDLPLTDKNLPNYNGRDCGGERITLTRALEVSCNVAFGAVGMKVGDQALREQAEKFGFGRRYFTDLDDALTRQSVSRFPEKLDAPTTAYSAIGQFDVAATPLQMAMVTAAIANNGQVMRPYLVDEIRTRDLDVVDRTQPESLGEAISPATASKLTDMMVAVVDNGTARPAQIPGVQVGGKTGTAQSAPDRPPYAWFVSFAPADDPQVAVAVLVADAGVSRDAISGSGLGAPIARAVMEAVIAQ